jgi:hypothetical protein
VTRRREDGADLRSEPPAFLPGWSRTETWEEHVEHARLAAHAALDGWAGWAELFARPGTPHVAAADAIVAAHFPGDATRLVVPSDAASVPLVSARLERSTRSFTAGQRVLVHDDPRARRRARPRRRVDPARPVHRPVLADAGVIR